MVARCTATAQRSRLPSARQRRRTCTGPHPNSTADDRTLPRRHSVRWAREITPMKLLAKPCAAAVLGLLVSVQVASAQTVDEVLNKSIAALGGRAALAKLKSRSSVGTITIMTPAGDISGTVEVLNAAPNKSRSLIKADLTA